MSTVIHNSFKRDRTAGQYHQNDWLSGFRQGLDEGLLRAGQADIGPAVRFTR
jgi:hypothetical protein